MDIRVVTTKGEFESASKLGFPTEPKCGDYASRYDESVVIRWGNSRTAHERVGRRKIEYKRVINSAKAIRLNCQKDRASSKLALVVNIPTLYKKRIPAGVLAVVRPIEHARGEAFSVIKGPFNLEPGTYGAKFIQTNAEYRVWFCGENTMAGRRVKMKINEEQEFPCRSNWGYEFCSGISADLHHQTLMAAKAIGLECGAADVLFHKGQYYFLELNSAPSVDHRVVREFFQKGIQELVKKKVAETPLTETERLLPDETKKEKSQKTVDGSLDQKSPSLSPKLTPPISAPSPITSPTAGRPAGLDEAIIPVMQMGTSVESDNTQKKSKQVLEESPKSLPKVEFAFA